MDTVRKAQSGERGALEKLFGDHVAIVQRYARRMCRDEESARDVAQDSLVTALKAIDTYRGEAAFSTWLFWITRSHCVRVRKQADRVPTLDQDTDQTMSDAPSPESQFEHSELSGAIEEAMNRLDRVDREVLWLRDVEGVATKQAAERLGMSVASLKSRLHRARDAVRAQVEKRMGGRRR